jgi:limonene-1,2-epoxide hydrolase
MKRRSFVGALGAASLAAGGSKAASAASAASAATRDAATGDAPTGSGAGPAPGSRHDYFQIYLDVIRAWKKHDADAVLGYMSDDLVWYVFVSQPPVRGKAGAAAVLAKLAPARHAENWRVFHHAVQGHRLFVEGVDDFTDANDHRIAVPYAGVVEFRDGLITGWRDYFDMVVVDKMKSGGAVPDAIEPLVSRKGLP